VLLPPLGGAGGILFLGCPCLRNHILTRYLKTLCRNCTYWGQRWIDFEIKRSKEIRRSKV